MSLPVSVVLPAYNAEQCVADAIRSVLDQTFADFELLIIDDGSTDRTAAVVKSFVDPRIVCVTHSRNLGLVAALNAGLTAARGVYVARMDADDACCPERFVKQVAFLEGHPSVGVLGSRMNQVDESGCPAPFFWVPLKHNEIAWTMLFETAMAHPTVMMRREVLAKAGGYDPAYKHIEDIELWMRLLPVTQFANLEEALYTRRCHSQSVCAQNAALQQVVGRRLRHQMWECVLGRKIDETMLDWMSEAAFPVLDRTEMMRLMEILLELMGRFTAANAVTGEELGHVHKDLVYRMLSVAQRNGYVHPNALKQPWKRLIPGPIKAMFKRICSAPSTQRHAPSTKNQAQSTLFLS